MTHILECQSGIRFAWLRQPARAESGRRVLCRSENPAVRVRFATPDDAEGIAAIEPDSSSWSIHQVTEELGRAVSRVHVAEEGHRVVGWLSSWYVPPHELQIIQIAVSSSKRRRGIATSLLNAVLDAYGPSVEQTVLEVREDNTPARGLYEKLGFVPLGAVRKKYYADGTGAVCMVRRTANL